jgi:hypothetical protein
MSFLGAATRPIDGRYSALRPASAVNLMGSAAHSTLCGLAGKKSSQRRRLGCSGGTLLP